MIDLFSEKTNINFFYSDGAHLKIHLSNDFGFVPRLVLSRKK